MVMKERVTYHDTRDDANEAQKYKGIEGYSEAYPMGVFPISVFDRRTGETRDKFKSVVKIYYG
mgnify:CR=1 FL=1